MGVETPKDKKETDKKPPEGKKEDADKKPDAAETPEAKAAREAEEICRKEADKTKDNAAEERAKFRAQRAVEDELRRKGATPETTAAVKELLGRQEQIHESKGLHNLWGWTGDWMEKLGDTGKSLLKFILGIFMDTKKLDWLNDTDGHRCRKELQTILGTKFKVVASPDDGTIYKQLEKEYAFYQQRHPNTTFSLFLKERAKDLMDAGMAQAAATATPDKPIKVPFDWFVSGFPTLTRIAADQQAEQADEKTRKDQNQKKTTERAAETRATALMPFRERLAKKPMLQNVVRVALFAQYLNNKGVNIPVDWEKISEEDLAEGRIPAYYRTLASSIKTKLEKKELKGVIGVRLSGDTLEEADGSWENAFFGNGNIFTGLTFTNDRTVGDDMGRLVEMLVSAPELQGGKSVKVLNGKNLNPYAQVELPKLVQFIQKGMQSLDLITVPKPVAPTPPAAPPAAPAPAAT